MSEIDWSKAPEGATHCAPEGLSREPRVCWYRRHEDRWEYFSPNRREWRRSANGQEFHDRLIPRPTQWRGPEDGLPPVGTVAMGKMPAWRKEEKCKVIAHLHGSCVVVYGLGDNLDRWSTLAWCDQFYPLKSDKERAVDEAMRASGHEKVGGFWTGSLDVYHAFGKAYDAGLLRLPEEPS